MNEIVEKVRAGLARLTPAKQKKAVEELKEFVSNYGKVNAVKLAKLRARIAKGKYWVPKVGEYIYTQTRMSLDHGEDDVVGGLSTVSNVRRDMSGGNAECVFIEIAEHERGGNWTQFLFPEQKKLQKEFGTRFAYPDPDYNDYD